jgi:acyl-CoA thioester hydrolase
MIEVYRGSINTWECDEMGHMNVRFYVAKMMEGLAEVGQVVGLGHAFRERAISTLAPRDQHIRFMREAKAGERCSPACLGQARARSCSISRSIT